MNSWTNLLVLAGMIVAVVLVGNFFAERKVSSLRARGIYPEKGKEREADVSRLLSAGEKIMAIRCYRALHKVGLKEAKEAVELLERKNA